VGLRGGGKRSEHPLEKIPATSAPSIPRSSPAGSDRKFREEIASDTPAALQMGFPCASKGFRVRSFYKTLSRHRSGRSARRGSPLKNLVRCSRRGLCTEFPVRAGISRCERPGFAKPPRFRAGRKERPPDKSFPAGPGALTPSPKPMDFPRAGPPRAFCFPSSPALNSFSKLCPESTRQIVSMVSSACPLENARELRACWPVKGLELKGTTVMKQPSALIQRRPINVHARQSVVAAWRRSMFDVASSMNDEDRGHRRMSPSQITHGVRVRLGLESGRMLRSDTHLPRLWWCRISAIDLGNLRQSCVFVSIVGPNSRFR